MTRVDLRLLQTNRHGVLSVPTSLWWCVALLLRHSLLLAVALVSAVAGAGSSDWVFALVSWPALLCEAPMWPLLLATARRSPEAGVAIRWLWRQGRWLLTLAVALQLGSTVWVLAHRELWNPWPERFMVVVAVIEAAIIVGIWRSPLYRQLFAEFPVAADLPSMGKPTAPPGPSVPPT